MNEPFVTKGELAKHLGVSSSTIRVWTSKKLIPEHTYLKVNNTYRYKLNAVSDALVEQRLQESKEKATKQKETVHVVDSIKNMYKNNDDLDLNDLDEDI
tara:strand:+ start:1636 stop:1932 length:297 start_codon:yes stop_codon:yes gene_type:complete